LPNTRDEDSLKLGTLKYTSGGLKFGAEVGPFYRPVSIMECARERHPRSHAGDTLRIGWHGLAGSWHLKKVVMRAIKDNAGKWAVSKRWRWIALGTAIAFGVLGLLPWEREPLPHGVYKGKAWHCFEEDGIPFIDIEGAICIRCPQIPVDVNRIDDADYQEILQREILKCMRNLDYDSPYAIEYRLDLLGFRETPLDRLKAAGRKYIRDFKSRAEEKKRAESESDQCFLAP
jgi:hypothetical protein